METDANDTATIRYVAEEIEVVLAEAILEEYIPAFLHETEKVGLCKAVEILVPGAVLEKPIWQYWRVKTVEHGTVHVWNTSLSSFAAIDELDQLFVSYFGKYVELAKRAR